MVDDAAASSRRRRSRRSDALENQERVLSAAVAAMRREGPNVALHAIATAAGVGTATLYRSFPDRDALLAALAHRAYTMIIGQLEQALRHDGPVLSAIDRFLEWNIDHRDDMVLPLHEGPVILDDASHAARQRISDAYTELLERGQRDGTIRADVSAIDMIVFGALLTQRMAAVPDWEVVARRQKRVFLDGLSAAGVLTPMPPSTPSIEQLRRDYPNYWR